MTTNTMRFDFGRNWSRFVETLTNNEFIEAEQSLRKMLGVDDLHGSTFLDAGCGSGLFSLAARQMGAKVMSFDNDPDCVKATKRLKAIWRYNDDDWEIVKKDVLNHDDMKSLEKCDTVYSWGVLHHTGDMWSALIILSHCVKKGGLFYISLYNDQWIKSDLWWLVKKTYNCSPRFVSTLMATSYFLLRFGLSAVRNIIRFRNPIRAFWTRRGMNMYRDAIDWVGGFPFETAQPNQVKAYCDMLGFDLVRENLVGKKSGCNEFVFKRRD